MELLVFEKRGKPENPEKTSRTKNENQEQSQRQVREVDRNGGFWLIDLGKIPKIMSLNFMCNLAENQKNKKKFKNF